MLKMKYGYCKSLYFLFVFANTIVMSCNNNPRVAAAAERNAIPMREVNADEIFTGNRRIAIVGATVIDGNGGVPIADGCVIVNGTEIEEVGSAGSVTIPPDAQVIDAKGMSILPGLIDAHFHLDNMSGLPALFLQHGVTSVRDPGAWIESYDGERKSGKMIPRLFLAGPHLDAPGPAYPHDAYIVRDSLEAVNAVNRQIDEGASVIKVYFRLSPGLIKVVCDAAHKRGVPVTAHLEITEAMEAINAGLDGVEHITSFGLSLQPRRKGEQYRQMVWADNDARKQGRYDVWSAINVNSQMADSVASFLVKKGTFVTPTLGPFEYRPTDTLTDSTKLNGFNNMKAFTAKLQQAGVHIVLGSHSSIPYADLGWAYQREMELLSESGISNDRIIVSATMENARYFRIADRLGSIEKGKLADIILVKGNPVTDIKAMRNIVRVMLNGKWVP